MMSDRLYITSLNKNTQLNKSVFVILIFIILYNFVSHYSNENDIQHYGHKKVFCKKIIMG